MLFIREMEKFLWIMIIQVCGTV